MCVNVYLVYIERVVVMKLKFDLEIDKSYGDGDRSVGRDRGIVLHCRVVGGKVVCELLEQCELCESALFSTLKGFGFEPYGSILGNRGYGLNVVEGWIGNAIVEGVNTGRLVIGESGIGVVLSYSLNRGYTVRFSDFDYALQYGEALDELLGIQYWVERDYSKDLGWLENYSLISTEKILNVLLERHSVDYRLWATHDEKLALLKGALYGYGGEKALVEKESIVGEKDFWLDIKFRGKKDPGIMVEGLGNVYVPGVIEWAKENWLRFKEEDDIIAVSFSLMAVWKYVALDIVKQNRLNVVGMRVYYTWDGEKYEASPTAMPRGGNSENIGKYLYSRDCLVYGLSFLKDPLFVHGSMAKQRVMNRNRSQPKTLVNEIKEVLGNV